MFTAAVASAMTSTHGAAHRQPGSARYPDTTPVHSLTQHPATNSERASKGYDADAVLWAQGILSLPLCQWADHLELPGIQLSVAGEPWMS
jgi:hypothetical protein